MSNNVPKLYLLDTNIISHAVRYPHAPLAKHIQFLSAGNPTCLCTSVIVVCELQFGITKRDADHLASKVEILLRFIRVLEIDSRVIPHYTNTRAHLERQGTPIGPNDMFIAAHALALGATLVTADAEFARIPGLTVENWLLSTAAQK